MPLLSTTILQKQLLTNVSIIIAYALMPFYNIHKKIAWLLLKNGEVKLQHLTLPNLSRI